MMKEATKKLLGAERGRKMNGLISFEQALEILKQIGGATDDGKQYVLNTYRVGVESFNDEGSFPGHCLHMSIGFVDRGIYGQAMSEMSRVQAKSDVLSETQEPSVLNLL